MLAILKTFAVGTERAVVVGCIIILLDLNVNYLHNMIPF